MTAPDLSIVIVNWNSQKFLRKCLTKIRSHSSTTTYEVIVVDNASFDGSESLVGGEFPWARFIQSDRNLGFARANNLGASLSSGRNIVFLNPDTEVLGAALDDMVKFADRCSEVGIAGPRLLNTDLSLQMESVKAFPSLLNQLLESQHLKARFPEWTIWGMRPLFEVHCQPAIVDVVSGACLLIKRSVFEAVGGFNTRYFMYSEDVDLCFKVRKAGLGVYFVGSAEVIHHGGRSSSLRSVSEFAAVLMRESRFRFFQISRGTAYACLYRLSTGIGAICRLGALALLFPILSFRRDTAVRGSMAKWARILLWSIGLARWVHAL